MKTLVVLIVCAITLLTGANYALAIPTVLVSHKSDLDTVVYYGNYGDHHGIAGNPWAHMGEDLVKDKGNGNFDQWFYGVTAENGFRGAKGIYSQWRINNGQCNGELVRQAYPSWGQHLTPGVDYCVTHQLFAGDNIPNL